MPHPTPPSLPPGHSALFDGLRYLVRALLDAPSAPIPRAVVRAQLPLVRESAIELAAQGTSPRAVRIRTAAARLLGDAAVDPAVLREAVAQLVADGLLSDPDAARLLALAPLPAS